MWLGQLYTYCTCSPWRLLDQKRVLSCHGMLLVGNNISEFFSGESRHGSMLQAASMCRVFGCQVSVEEPATGTLLSPSQLASSSQPSSTSMPDILFCSFRVLDHKVGTCGPCCCGSNATMYTEPRCPKCTRAFSDVVQVATPSSELESGKTKETDQQRLDIFAAKYRGRFNSRWLNRTFIR